MIVPMQHQLQMGKQTRTKTDLGCGVGTVMAPIAINASGASAPPVALKGGIWDYLPPVRASAANAWPFLIRIRPTPPAYMNKSCCDGGSHQEAGDRDEETSLTALEDIVLLLTRAAG